VKLFSTLMKASVEDHGPKMRDDSFLPLHNPTVVVYPTVLNSLAPFFHPACDFFILNLIALIAAGPAFDNAMAAAMAAHETDIRCPVLQPCR
jgi:hypothetical protein